MGEWYRRVGGRAYGRVAPGAGGAGSGAGSGTIVVVGGLIGHAGVIRELRALATSDEPPHALLFAGPEGTGRRLLALEYAKMLNCEGGAPVDPAAPALFDDTSLRTGNAEVPCGVCRPCRLIADGAHPDILTLAPGDVLCRPREGEGSHAKHPDSRDIRICQIRGLIDLVARYPFEGRYRVITIDPAERLGRDAAHTLLKTLEEPPGHTAICLVSSAPESIIETILSRCRRIDVRTVPRAEIEAGLMERGVEPALAAAAAEAARGRPGRAIAFANDPDLIGVRERLLERCAQMAGASTAERFDYAGKLAERWRSDRAQVAPELDAWEAFWEERLRAASMAGPDRRDEAIEDLGALKAVVQCMADLLANVVPRAAMELMLLSFPRRTLAVHSEEDTAAYA